MLESQQKTATRTGSESQQKPVQERKPTPQQKSVTGTEHIAEKTATRTDPGPQQITTAFDAPHSDPLLNRRPYSQCQNKYMSSPGNPLVASKSQACRPLLICTVHPLRQKRAAAPPATQKTKASRTRSSSSTISRGPTTPYQQYQSSFDLSTERRRSQNAVRKSSHHIFPRKNSGQSPDE